MARVLVFRSLYGVNLTRQNNCEPCTHQKLFPSDGSSLDYVTRFAILIINIHKIIVKTRYYFTYNVTSMGLDVIFCLCEIIKLLILVCFFSIVFSISGPAENWMPTVGNLKTNSGSLLSFFSIDYYSGIECFELHQ